MEQFGGLYRSIELEATSAAFIDDVWARPDLAYRGANLQIQLTRNSQAPPTEYCVSVEVSRLEGHPAGKAQLQVGSIEAAGATVTVHVTLDPFRPWNPEQPALYKATVTPRHGGQSIDAWVERFGVRELERRGPDIYLNGSRYFLRGFCDDYVIR